MPAASKVFLLAGALLGALAVALGAFGAHALKQRLAPEAQALWQTAVQYHFWHVLALVGAGLAAFRLPESTWLAVSGASFITGVLLFSGSLYALALGAPRGFGIVTPFGGAMLIFAWLALAIAVLRV